jgi:hypothetical protein
MVAVPVNVGMRKPEIDQIYIRVVFEVEIALTRDEHIVRLNIAVYEAQFV